jgi:hypothetical protein
MWHGYAWRVGARHGEWTIGVSVRRDFAMDVWLISFLCFALAVNTRR